jgi:hypothetical protein
MRPKKPIILAKKFKLRTTDQFGLATPVQKIIQLIKKNNLNETKAQTTIYCLNFCNKIHYSSKTFQNDTKNENL